MMFTVVLEKRPAIAVISLVTLQATRQKKENPYFIWGGRNRTLPNRIEQSVSGFRGNNSSPTKSDSRRMTDDRWVMMSNLSYFCLQPLRPKMPSLLFPAVEVERLLGGLWLASRSVLVGAKSHGVVDSLSRLESDSSFAPFVASCY